MEGKVILSTGAFVPRAIQGQWLHDRVDKWHCQNPGQLVAGHLMYDVLQAHPQAQNNVHVPAVDASYTLSTDNHITSLEHELFSLHGTKATRLPTIMMC